MQRWRASARPRDRRHPPARQDRRWQIGSQEVLPLSRCTENAHGRAGSASVGARPLSPDTGTVCLFLRSVPCQGPRGQTHPQAPERRAWVARAPLPHDLSTVNYHVNWCLLGSQSAANTLTNGGVCRMRRMPPVSRLAPRTDGGKTERESGHAQYTYGNRIEWHPIC